MASQGEASTISHRATTGVILIFRHFHPILAGAAERFRRYSVPLAKEGLSFQTYTLRENAEHPEEETLHPGLHVRRITTYGKAWQRDAVLFQRAFEDLSHRPTDGRNPKAFSSSGITARSSCLT